MREPERETTPVAYRNNQRLLDSPKPVNQRAQLVCFFFSFDSVFFQNVLKGTEIDKQIFHTFRSPISSAQLAHGRNITKGKSYFELDATCTMKVERCWSGCSGLALYGLLAFLLGMSVQVAQAGCGERESPNCCSGRNNECFEYTKRKTVCYCDTYCQKTGDCCEDYKSVCQISGEFLHLFQPPTIFLHR